MENFAFGPIPSRRLGKSLGINNIPVKHCTYSCIYCQLGKTTTLMTERQAFYEPEAICAEVKKKVGEALQRGYTVDYLTFVPDGEPTLDLNLGDEISYLKEIGIPIAVLTNASLLWRDDVRENLMGSDLVSLKLDAISQDLWKRIDRPHKNLELKAILEGMLKFADDFKGTIISETMLVDGFFYGNELKKIADFLSSLKRLDMAYVAIPTRPPTEKWVKPASEEVVNAAFQIFSEKLDGKVECLTGYEGNAFASTGNAEDDLLSITSVHPMRSEAVKELLSKNNTDLGVLDKLLMEGKIVELRYEGDKYYMRKLPTRAED
jgi:wyosine [tRNA(Phe)-imidazoG37] synthetase (radical SAM superfamily)